MALPEYTLKDLLESGVHFGHQTHRWNPLMQQYIYGVRNGIHIIDLTQTFQLLDVALNYFIVRRTHEYGTVEPTLIEASENSNWLTLIDNDTLHIDVERVPTSGENGCVESTHFSVFWNNDTLKSRMQALLPDSEVVSRR